MPAPGYATVRRAFARRRRRRARPADAAAVHRPDPRVDAVRGCVAVERGPEVFCLESVDLDGAELAELSVDLGVPPHETASGVAVSVRRLVGDDAVGEVPLIPYHSWAERGPSTMRVWLPVHQER